MVISSPSHYSDLTALPSWPDSRPSTRAQSRGSTRSGESSTPTVSSTTSKDSVDPGRKGRFNFAFHALHQNLSRRSSSKSLRDGAINENQVGQKENIQPGSRTPTSDCRERSPDSVNSSKSGFGGGIPLLRRARSNLVRTGQLKHPTQRARWGEFRGEPTSSPTGRPAQVSPSAFDDSFGGFQNGERYGTEVYISGGGDKPKKTTFAARAAARFGMEALPEVLPLFKGNGGKSAVVDPASNTPQAHSPNMYTAVKNFNDMSLKRSNRRGRVLSDETFDVLNGYETESLGNGARTPVGVSSTAPVAASPTLKSTVDPAEIISKVPARKPVSAVEPGTGEDQATHVALEPAFVPSRRASTDSHDSTLTAYGKPVEEPRSHFSWSTYAESASEFDDNEGDEGKRQSQAQMYPGKIQYGGQDEEPISRFSWTTIATDTTDQQTPPASPGAWSQKTPSPIMMRRRPLAGHFSRSAVEQQTPRAPFVVSDPGDATPRLRATTSPLTGRKPSLSSPSATDKALPPRPTVEEESTHIDALQAKVDDQDIRQSNLQRVILKLEKVERASPLEVTEKMRRENRRKLSEVRSALEEVQREKHEAGMALSRARNKAQREDNESSPLWLRRVTG